MEIDDPTKIECPCSDELRQVLWNFHIELLSHCGHPGPQVQCYVFIFSLEPKVDSLISVNRLYVHRFQIEEEETEKEDTPPTWKDRLLALIKSKDEPTEDEDPYAGLITSYNRLIISTIKNWAMADFINDQELIRQMFSLLHRQYDAAGEVSSVEIEHGIVVYLALLLRN